MIEIRYTNQYEVADLSGRSVSETRKLFKNELGIPDKASARLNGKRVKGSLEAETLLTDCDTLSFAQPRGKGIFLVGALLLTMVITGSVFAATATSDTVTLVITQDSDLATVTQQGGPTWTVFPCFKGTIDNAALFEVDPDSDFTGDLLASIYITNGDDLVEVYKALVMEIQVFDKNGDNVTGIEYLTLGGSEVSLAFTQTSALAPYTVNVTDGYFSTFRWAGTPTLTSEDPIIFCEVSQASAQAAP